MAASPAASSLALCKSADIWLSTALAKQHNHSDLRTECLGFLDHTGATSPMPVLNAAWRWLKTLCLDAACDDLAFVHQVLERSVRAACVHFAAVASAGNPAL